VKTKTRPRSTWQLQEAKNRFSEVVRLSHSNGPQTITLHGKPAAVLISAEEFKSMKHSKPKPNLAEFLLNGPFAGSGLVLERIDEPIRDIDL
jgi:antitoxin Phd